MVSVDYKSDIDKIEIPKDLIKGKRLLTKAEIQILEKNLNHNEDSLWNNFYVDAEENCFDAELIHFCDFSGYVILGKLKKGMLNYNDLHLECGIERSKLHNVVTGDDNVIRNVAYLDNYRLGNRVILFNINEMCCTRHSKFGNGILKNGESEDNRIWIGVANENDGRSILPFESLIPADAYLWSHYRDDNELLNRFVQLTEYGNTKELNTFGFVDDDCVIKNSNIIKDAKIGKCVYIKGAFKLKNITILSSPEERSQIGEGVEMVNGILGYGSKLFYQAIAVRFVIGRNCQVKYGARLLNSVLGDNSTISCCEVLNNLIFPFHEQHHNSSFLIATTIMGQSNIASGATIGSNHNSRSPDGEIFAKRGFWPGLCSDFKHNSRFASFVLVSKGSYQHELDIPYPFSLVSPGDKSDEAISIIPAFWFMYDMFAITRNKNKFTKRDKRIVKVQHIEFDPLAPDTMQEILFSTERLIGLTAEYLKENQPDAVKNAKTQQQIFQCAKDFLHKNEEADFTLFDQVCQKKFGAIILKPVKAYKMYRKIVKYFATRTLMEFCKSLHEEYLNPEMIEEIRKLPLYTQWENVGGQIIPCEKINELFADIKSGKYVNWDEVHDYYNLCEASYEKFKVRYALYLLEQLYSRPIEDFSSDIYRDVIEDVIIVANEIYNHSVQSREKDYTDYYRNMTYRNRQEMEIVIGPLSDNSFLNQLKVDTEQFVKEIGVIFKGLIK
ncbi:MAG: DUF4954 family protein [Treponema sp.]|nr:DUF4954 family protein [Treponema sp.]